MNAEALVNASWIVHTDRSSSNKRNTFLAQDIQTFSKYCMTEMKCLYSGNSWRSMWNITVVQSGEINNTQVQYTHGTNGNRGYNYCSIPLTNIELITREEQLNDTAQVSTNVHSYACAKQVKSYCYELKKHPNKYKMIRVQ